MAENKQRQNNARTQNTDWDENAIRRGSTGSDQESFDTDWEESSQSRQPRLTRTNYQGSSSDPSTRYYDSPGYNSDTQNYNQQGSSFGERNYDSGTQRNSWNNNNQYNTRNNQNSFNTPSQNQSHNNSYQGQTHPGNQWQGQQNNPYWLEDQMYGNPNTARTQYDNYNTRSGQPYAERSYSQSQQPLDYSQQFRDYSPGQWNEANYRQNQGLYGGQQGQHQSNLGVNNYGQEPNWMNRNQSTMGINEQGGLFSSGPHKGKGPKGYHRSDDRIKEDINDRLMDDAQLDASDIEVEVDNNEVVLSGTVASREAKRRAEDIVEMISGVSNVENHLRINKENDRRYAASSSSSNESKSKRNSLTGTTM